MIAEHRPLLAEGRLGPGNTNPDIRRSQIAMLGVEPKYDWLYDRIWAAAQECNRQFFCVDLAGVEANNELGRYDYGEQPQRMDRRRGAFIAFPSFLLHRVTPVTRGTRWSLVAWILGPRWR